MATSRNNAQYTSEQFVESCGAILFDLCAPIKTVCLIYYQAKDEWLLAKGRRNCGESRQNAALREIHEETGFKARLYPITMYTRAPPIDEDENVSDEPRSLPNLTEPFMVTMRQLDSVSDRADNVKIIWWYIATLDKGSSTGFVGTGGEEQYTPRFFPLDEAVSKLSFQSDQAVLQKAISLVE